MGTSNKTRLLCSATALLLICSGLACGAEKKTEKKKSEGATYRWVDEKGVTHYGDRVPPQYVKQERTILNRRGVEVGRLEAQKTPEQLAEEERQRQEMERQKQRDTFLLTTYTSVKDIEELRDARLEQLKGQRLAAEQYIANLHDRLVTLQARSMVFKPYNPQPSARRMPDDLAEEIVRTLNEIRTQRNAMAEKLAEEDELRQEFQADIERFKELRTARAK